MSAPNPDELNALLAAWDATYLGAENEYDGRCYCYLTDEDEWDATECPLHGGAL